MRSGDNLGGKRCHELPEKLQRGVEVLETPVIEVRLTEWGVAVR